MCMLHKHTFVLLGSHKGEFASAACCCRPVHQRFGRLFVFLVVCICEWCGDMLCCCLKMARARPVS